MDIEDFTDDVYLLSPIMYADAALLETICYEIKLFGYIFGAIFENPKHFITILFKFFYENSFVK